MAQGSFAAARIAVVDDEQANVRLMTQILRSAGYGHVAGYTDPELALARLSTDSTDLVLLDLHMPGIDGLEFLARLRATADPTDFVPVIMLTGDLTRDALRRSLEAGANEFLTKPMAAGEVLPFAETYVRTTPKFETSDERYSWLSEVVALGYNILSPNHIDYRIYRVL